MPVRTRADARPHRLRRRDEQGRCQQGRRDFPGRGVAAASRRRGISSRLGKFRSASGGRRMRAWTLPPPPPCARCSTPSGSWRSPSSWTARP